MCPRSTLARGTKQPKRSSSPYLRRRRPDSGALARLPPQKDSLYLIRSEGTIYLRLSHAAVATALRHRAAVARVPPREINKANRPCFGLLPSGASSECAIKRGVASPSLWGAATERALPARHAPAWSRQGQRSPQLSRIPARCVRPLGPPLRGPQAPRLFSVALSGDHGTEFALPLGGSAPSTRARLSSGVCVTCGGDDEPSAWQDEDLAVCERAFFFLRGSRGASMFAQGAPVRQLE